MEDGIRVPDVLYRRERKIGHGHAPKKQTIRMKESESIEDRFCPAGEAYPRSHQPHAQGSGSIKVSKQKSTSKISQLSNLNRSTVAHCSASVLVFKLKLLVARPVRLFRGSLVRGGSKKSAVKKGTGGRG